MFNIFLIETTINENNSKALIQYRESGCYILTTFQQYYLNIYLYWIRLIVDRFHKKYLRTRNYYIKRMKCEQMFCDTGHILVCSF